MHVAVSIVVVGLLYLGLFHTGVNRWVVLVGALVLANVAHVLAPGAFPPLLLVIEYLALFVVLAVGFTKRRLDAVADDLDDLSIDPSAVRADGVALSEHLEAAGFVRAPEGWMHFERHGWDAIAMQREATIAFMISGDRGPLIEFTSALDAGTMLLTVSRARDRLPSTMLRQCFPDADVDTLLREHERTVEWLRRSGHSARSVPLEELTDFILTEERSVAGARSGVVGSIVRELRRQHLDVGTVIDRPDVLDRLRSLR